MNLGLLLLRVLLGLTLAAHGSQKLFGWFGGGGIEGTGVFFENHLGFRPGRRHALAAALSEFGGGLLVVLGLLHPLACAAIIGTMLVAGWAAHRGNGFFITKGGYEYTVILGGLAAGLAFTGPGRVSIDNALGWHLFGAVWGFVAVVLGLAGGATVLAGQGREVEDEPSAAAAADTADGPGTTLSGGREAGLDRSPARESETTDR